MICQTCIFDQFKQAYKWTSIDRSGIWKKNVLTCPYFFMEAFPPATARSLFGLSGTHGLPIDFEEKIKKHNKFAAFAWWFCQSCHSGPQHDWPRSRQATWRAFEHWGVRMWEGAAEGPSLCICPLAPTSLLRLSPNAPSTLSSLVGLSW